MYPPCSGSEWLFVDVRQVQDHLPIIVQLEMRLVRVKPQTHLAVMYHSFQGPYHHLFYRSFENSLSGVARLDLLTGLRY
jgi:hypothetical protein